MSTPRTPVEPTRIKPDGSTPRLLFSLPPLSLYVHVPWCIRKCPYCDFNSHALKGELPEAEYLEALQADLEQALPLIWGRQIVSVFIGGGTPSLLSAQAVDQMLGMFRAMLNVWPGTEITLEANPGTAEAARFQAYAAAGVSRLSLGVQSFNDAALTALGRVHDGRQALAAIDMAKNAFDRINLDLMFGLPGQSREESLLDLDTALEHEPGHLSLYQLTLEPNTVFAKYPPALPDEDTIALMQEAMAPRLQAAGFEQYEVSAWARPDQQAIHNVNYWEFGDYLGLGPGAHSKLSFPDRVIRQERRRQPESWMQHAIRHDASHISLDRRIRADEFPFEFMLNVLRLKDGVPLSLYFERTGQPMKSIGDQLVRARERGLLQNSALHLRATPLGWRFLNELQAEFLAD